jgi:hypothetical protein
MIIGTLHLFRMSYVNASLPLAWDFCCVNVASQCVISWCAKVIRCNWQHSRFVFGKYPVRTSALITRSRKMSVWLKEGRPNLSRLSRISRNSCGIPDHVTSPADLVLLEARFYKWSNVKRAHRWSEQYGNTVLLFVTLALFHMLYACWFVCQDYTWRERVTWFVYIGEKFYLSLKEERMLQVCIKKAETAYVTVLPASCCGGFGFKYRLGYFVSFS